MSKQFDDPQALQSKIKERKDNGSKEFRSKVIKI